MSVSTSDREMEFDGLHVLENFLDIYDEPGEMVVTEAIGNALDANATEIKINLRKGKKSGNYLISFYNNGPAMTKNQFADYHIVAKSSKTKGASLGFAGIGAKVYLARWDETFILTETSDGNVTYSSEMYRKGRGIKWGERTPTTFKKGTTYTVKLKQEDYDYLWLNITRDIVSWFNPALRSGLKVTVNGMNVDEWSPTVIEKRSGQVKIPGKKLDYTFFLTDDEIDVDRRNIEYHVSGKSVTVVKPTNLLGEVKAEFKNNFYVEVDAINISEYLKTSKTAFKTGTVTGQVYAAVEKAVYSELKDLGCIVDPNTTKPISNKITQFLEDLIKKKFPELTPNSLMGTITCGGNGGTHKQGTKSINGPKNGSPGTNSSGGSGTGTGGQRKGFSWVLVNRPKDPRMGWIEPSTFEVVVNMGHGLYQKVNDMQMARNYHVIKVIAGVLIRAAASMGKMTVEQAMDTENEILTECEAIIN